jgi:hypothetical protein
MLTWKTTAKRSSMTQVKRFVLEPTEKVKNASGRASLYLPVDIEAARYQHTVVFPKVGQVDEFDAKCMVQFYAKLDSVTQSKVVLEFRRFWAA